MIYFDDSDIIVQKVLSNKIVDSLRAILIKLLKVCEKTALELQAVEKLLEEATDVKDIAIYSKKLKEMQAKLVLALALKGRVQAISQRNEDRVEMLNDRLESAGIYNERFDKKVLSNMETAELKNISESELNLNPALTGGVRLKFVEGETLAFVDGKLNFSVPYNINVMRSLSSETLTKLIELYPYAVSTIPDEVLLDVKTKQNVLKGITSFVTDEIKVKTIKDINKDLGGVLSFRTEITQTATDYMAGVQNLFDVICKQQLLEKYPHKAEEFASKLKCNEKSELLPSSRKVAVFADGLAADEKKSEEQESEEVRIEQEREDLIQDLISMMYEEMIQNDEQEQMNAENDRAEEEMQKQEELLLKKQKDKEKAEEEAQKQEDEAMSQLSRMLTHHDD